ncbi:Hypothetical predicted protein [Olea europaea subsp. europaea]|uniref:HMA domain-containing protein n=1 Tax=Olea europaea subsp. europaea TaxID=158383 RepID=A0A8S0R884_OLEEU|nr:Hypothetical predicted protein [Olea europaea subsp. europaea]
MISFKKILQNIGILSCVYTINIEPKQQKVTVTGNIDAQTLIKKLVRNGKHAELWPEKRAGKGKKSKKSHKEYEPKSSENSDEEDEETQVGNNPEVKISNSSPRVNGGNGGPTVKFTGVDTVLESKSPGNVVGGDNFRALEQKIHPNVGAGGGGGGKKKKKKKKKGHKGNNSNSAGSGAPPPNRVPASIGLEIPNTGPTQAVDQTNLGPSLQNVMRYPPSYGPQQAHVMSYNAAHPTASVSTPSCYMPASSPYMYAQAQSGVYQSMSTPLNSFEILSDENPNGCYIM